MGENSVNWKGQILSKGKNESMPSGPQELEGKEGSTKGQKIKNLWAISNYQEKLNSTLDERLKTRAEQFGVRQ